MGLDELEGIRGGSRVCGSDGSVVEKLMEVGKETVDRHLKKASPLSGFDNTKEEEMYPEVKGELDNVEFTEQDIGIFIQAMSDNDYNETQHKKEI